MRTKHQELWASGNRYREVHDMLPNIAFLDAIYTLMSRIAYTIAHRRRPMASSDQRPQGQTLYSLLPPSLIRLIAISKAQIRR